MFAICNALTVSLMNMLRVENASIYIISQPAKDLYNASRTDTEILSKVRIGPVLIDLHKQPGIDVELPIFKNIQEINYPIRKDNTIVVAATLRGDKAVAI